MKNDDIRPAVRPMPDGESVPADNGPTATKTSAGHAASVLAALGRFAERAKAGQHNEPRPRWRRPGAGRGDDPLGPPRPEKHAAGNPRASNGLYARAEKICGVM